MRVVLDTNVFVSAILGGKLGIILDEWRADQFTLLVSEAIVREYLDVIHRPKFKFSPVEIATITEYGSLIVCSVAPTYGGCYNLRK